MHERSRARWVGYGVAVLGTAACLLVRWPLWPVRGDAVPHMTFFPAVMMAAYYGGFWPGLLATGLSAVAANYFLTRQLSSFQVTSVNDVTALILFGLVGTIISGLCESLHRARRRIVAGERQRAAQVLRESEERFRQLAENIHEVFWMIDAREGRYVYVSPAYEEVSGRPRQSLYEQPRSWIETIHPDDRDRVIAQEQQLRRGVFTEWEFRVVRPDGSVRWVRARAFPVKDPDGNLARLAGLAEDVTERKQAEEALVRERYLLHTLMDNLPDNIYFKDTASRFVRINKALTTDFGLSDPAQAIGKTDFDFYTEEHARPAYADEQEIMQSGQPVVGKEEKETWLDGRVRWVSTTKMPFRDKDGTISGTFGVARDITKVKLAEEALRESEHRWRSLAEALPQLVWTATPDGACDYFSTQWTEYTGVAESDLLGWRWLEVLHPDDRELTRQFWMESVAGRGPYDVEYRVRRSDGAYRWFKTRGVPIRDCGGSMVKWFGTCTDITAGKQLEEELRQANTRLDVAVRGSNIAIWENDMPDGVLENARIHHVNYWEQLGYDRPESPTDYAAIIALVHPDDRERMRRDVQACLSGETREYESEYRVRHRDGSYRWVLSRGVAVRDAAGKPILFAGSRTDITDRKRAEKELCQAKEAAEAANRAKDEFLANVSHEIRTPMNAILGMTELVLDTTLTEDQRQCLKTVRSAADSLLGIINDLLDFSKIEAGKLELDPAPFSLRAAVGDTLRALAVRAHKKGLEMVSHVQPDVPDALVGDAGRLRQVLLNLVGNAIKFTEEGEAVVKVEVVSGGVVSGERSETDGGPSALTTHHSPLTCASR
jgi:PAS domain S-box-containing protein